MQSNLSPLELCHDSACDGDPFEPESGLEPGPVDRPAWPQHLSGANCSCAAGELCLRGAEGAD